MGVSTVAWGSTKVQFDNNAGPARRLVSEQPEQIATYLRQYQDWA